MCVVVLVAGAVLTLQSPRRYSTHYHSHANVSPHNQRMVAAAAAVASTARDRDQLTYAGAHTSMRSGVEPHTSYNFSPNVTPGAAANDSSFGGAAGSGASFTSGQSEWGDTVDNILAAGLTSHQPGANNGVSPAGDIIAAESMAAEQLAALTSPEAMLVSHGMGNTRW
jgi:hypothetical protein